MRIHHLSCGTMCPLGGRLLFYRSSPDPALHRLVCQCLLIETDGDGLVLVDTGFGLRDVHQPRARLSGFFRTLNGIKLRENETALRQIEGLGFGAADVRHIVITHLDFDHAGGIEDFPGAVVHIFEVERRAASEQRAGFITKQRYRPQQWDQGVRWQGYEAGGEPWFGFDCVRDLKGLPPEILMVPLIGHTWGHCGVAVRAQDRWVLNAGDAYFYFDEMNLQAAHCTLGLRSYQRMMEVDRRARLGNQDRLRALLRSEGRQVEIFCSHDPTEFVRLAARGPYSTTLVSQAAAAHG